MAKRLKCVLPKLIDESQSAFLRVRVMLDSVLIANEVAHDAKRRGVPTMVFKVDYEKTYDSVKWSFPFYMLGRMNFHEKWIEWIQGCLCSSTVSVFVNDSLMEDFKMEKCLRQRDLIAHFLFLIVAEGISGMLNSAISLGRFSPYTFGNSSSFSVSLLKFEDHTLFIGDGLLKIGHLEKYPPLF
ncbi:uncharacterized protein LOC130728064 [Lotus japonicus]|uniref:uncharacterized protein LOC130728064 n=1 Tax=Lotus japonicus TaxID=34305 RepID=UPI0025889A01|nr:uncharacterized protein LOC130728064 [Lotus japonicus]